MLIPYILPPDPTNFEKPNSVCEEQYVSREETNAPTEYQRDIPNNQQNNHNTEFSMMPISQEKNEDSFNISTTGQISALNSEIYSKEYVKFNTRSLISEIESELDSWIMKGTEDSYIHILSIKEKLEKYENYFEDKPENRILLSALELIFQNNQWDSIPVNKLQFLKDGIQRFSDGEVKNSDLVKFLKVMHEGKITPLITV